MLEQAVRHAILELHRRGQGVRAIARALQVSRAAVRDILRRGSAEVPRLARAEKALDHRDDILQLLQQCEGSFMRVHEELTKRGLQLSYPALTAFCRRHGIGHVPKLPAGRYDFAPGQEMQHDTSPHDLHLGGKLRRVQTASLVLAYSRMLFFQFYPQFRRFEDKVFLTEALRYMDGACQTCMIDNTHVVVLKGTGAAMIPVPEMAAFAERFGFTFVAHAVGDANRSGRVERMFRFIERGFLPGRRFTDWTDANRQARAWCDRVNARPKRQLKATPARALRRRASGPAPAAPLDPRALPAPSATRRRRGLRHAPHQSLLRAQRAHRPAPRRARARRSRRHLRRRPARSPRMNARSSPSTATCSGPSIGRRAARAGAGTIASPFPKRRTCAACCPRSTPTSRPSSAAASCRPRWPCASSCAWPASIRPRRCSRPSRPPPTTASTTSAASSAWSCAASPRPTSSCRCRPDPPQESPTMSRPMDELQQLLKNLHLSRMAEDPA